MSVLISICKRASEFLMATAAAVPATTGPKMGSSSSSQCAWHKDRRQLLDIGILKKCAEALFRLFQKVVCCRILGHLRRIAHSFPFSVLS